jgi:hypothetical protein
MFFIKTFLQWRRDIEGNGNVLSMLIDCCWTVERDAPYHRMQAKGKKINLHEKDRTDVQFTL